MEFFDDGMLSNTMSVYIVYYVTFQRFYADNRQNCDAKFQ